MINRPPDRQYLKDRLDRGRWKFDGREDLKGMVDAHVLRPGYMDANWAKLRVLLRELLIDQEEWYQWTDEYRNRFVQLLGDSSPSNSSPNKK